MDKLIIGGLISMVVLGYCRIFWNNDSVELKPTLRMKLNRAIYGLYQKISQLLRLKAK